VLEVSLLVAVAFFLPSGPHRLVWTFVILFIALPGVYAMVKGAPFVPTGNNALKRMIKFAKIKKGETAVDMGCGDGRIVFAAANVGAKATGYELSVPMFAIAWVRSLFHKNSSIRFLDFWKQDYSKTNVIFCYLLTEPMQRFKKEIWPTLKPGTRVVSQSFRIKGLKPDKEEKNVMLYVKK
jgi:ribosomal protein L11 methylase PrmA